MQGDFLTNIIVKMLAIVNEKIRPLCVLTTEGKSFLFRNNPLFFHKFLPAFFTAQFLCAI